jgi:hypothetical protein
VYFGMVVRSPALQLPRCMIVSRGIGALAGCCATQDARRKASVYVRAAVYPPLRCRGERLASRNTRSAEILFGIKRVTARQPS